MTDLKTAIEVGLKLSEGATRGPWTHEADMVWGFCPLVHNPSTRTEGIVSTESHAYDREYIVHACNNFPALCAEVRRLEAVIDSFYTEIAHGDDEHRAWLLAKVKECKQKRFDDLVTSLQIERKLKDI